MKLGFNVLGWRDLDKFITAMARMALEQHTAYVDALEEGANVIVDQIRININALFDTEGSFPASVRVVKVNQYRVDIVVDKVYAAVHEYGGTFDVTEKQKGYFWYKYSETGDSMWKALALSKSYTIPPRPYFRPAIETHKRKAVEATAKALGEAILTVARRHGG